MPGPDAHQPWAFTLIRGWLSHFVNDLKTTRLPAQVPGPGTVALGLLRLILTLRALALLASDQPPHRLYGAGRLSSSRGPPDLAGFPGRARLLLLRTGGRRWESVLLPRWVTRFLLFPERTDLHVGLAPSRKMLCPPRRTLVVPSLPAGLGSLRPSPHLFDPAPR